MPRIKEDSAKKKRLQAKSAQIGEPENIFDSENIKSEESQEKNEIKVATVQKTEAETNDQQQNDEKKTRTPKVRGKKIVQAQKNIEKNREYTFAEALEVIKKTSYSKFPGTLEIHLSLADKDMRGTLSLPHGSGKTVKVLAFVPDAKVKEAIDSGAAYAGGQNLVEEIKTNKITAGKDFNAVVADPTSMPVLAPLAKILGPKGMMPNPKTNTVGTNIAQLVANLLKGQVNYKAEMANPHQLHIPLGKINLDDDKLHENYDVVIKTFGQNKIRKAVLSATMAPGIQITI